MGEHFRVMKLLVLLIVFYSSHAEAQGPPPSVDLSRDMVVSHFELFNYFWVANFQNFTLAQHSCSTMARKGKKGKALKSKKNPTTACPTYDELMNSWADALCVTENELLGWSFNNTWDQIAYLDQILELDPQLFNYITSEQFGCSFSSTPLQEEIGSCYEDLVMTPEEQQILDGAHNVFSQYSCFEYALFQSPALANAAREIKFQLYASGP